MTTEPYQELETFGPPEKEPLHPPKEYISPTHVSSFVAYFTASYVVTAMLVFVPVGIALGATEQDPNAIFILNFLGICALAKLLGDATEQLALHTSQSIGGLLNATFGNAVEIIISIIALKAGLIRVVQSSLIGSILSNLLLVLGMCFVAGGFKHNVMKFDTTAAQTSSGILFLAVLAVVMPAALKYQVQDDQAKLDEYILVNNITANETDYIEGFELHPLPLETRLLVLSRGTAIIMLIVYGLFLFFQLKTHTQYYQDKKKEDDLKKEEDKEQDKKKEEEEESEEDERPQLTMAFALIALAVVTVFVAVCSDYLVDSLDEVTQAWGISETFAGMILLPIVGNAAEHLTAVTVAMKNKLDLSIGVAVGSSQQIAMMVVPLLVILGWIMDQPMSLYFDVFETAVLFMTVIVVHSLIMDGESNWFEGAMLLSVYCILGIAFYVV